MAKTITREELKRRLDAGEPLVLFEALPQEYYDHAHLPGAVRLNYDEAEERAFWLAPDRFAPVVAYCASDTCPNSHKLAEILEAQGYTDVSVYVGGKKEWIAAGYPVVGKHAAAQKEAA